MKEWTMGDWYIIVIDMENTMNLSKDLSVDKELFSGVYEGKYIRY